MAQRPEHLDWNTAELVTCPKCNKIYAVKDKSGRFQSQECPHEKIASNDSTN